MSLSVLRCSIRGICRFSVLSTFTGPSSLHPVARVNHVSLFRTISSSTPVRKHDMFCFQCEQTTKHEGCTKVGNCGKQPSTAALQDMLLEVLKGVSQYATRARKLGIVDNEADRAILSSTFSTLTNVNFDDSRFVVFINEAVACRDRLKKAYEEACSKKGIQPDVLGGVAVIKPAASLDLLVQQGKSMGIESRRVGVDPDVFSLQELLVYGVKGTAAYAEHARKLGKVDSAIFGFIHDAYDYVSRPTAAQKLDDLLALCLKCGEVNLRTMQILYEGHQSTLGTPEPTKVRTTPVKGKCLVVSGHDLHDMLHILKATEGKGINVYTHGEMLPGHGYPQLHAFKHLVGNYGGAWQLQKSEFEEFPGSIIVTTNCILAPRPSYKNRIFSLNEVGHHDVKHLKDHNIDEAIKAALAMPGFQKDEPAQYTMTGFGHSAILGIADTIVDLVKKGTIKHFFLIGGCDGAEDPRSYFHDFALATPKDSVILTLACGKYRFNKEMDLIGNIPGTQLPRLLDVGQCNDAYSAVQVAVALASAFKTDVTKLPLSFIISWFEQKAVAVLLTLLHLGIQNIHLGPALPAFITPNILNVLVEKYKIKPTGDHEQDLKNCLNRV